MARLVSVLLLILLVGVSWSLVRAIRVLAQRWQLLDLPNQRSSHDSPTPRGGGLAIVSVTITVGAWYLVAVAFQPAVLAYLTGATLIAAVSFADDRRSVSNRLRLVCHIFAAILFVVVLLLNYDAALASLRLPVWLLAPLATIWLVALTNIYNFMDGIDGLAGGQAAVGAGWWLLSQVSFGTSPVVPLALALLASSIGFLAHNWSPASIFMGDVGSAFLGFTFAALPFLAFPARPHPSLLLCGLLVIWPFVFDATLTIIRRIAARENIFQAHRSHLYQRLVIRGWSHRAVSLLYVGYALVCACCAFLIDRDARFLFAALLPIGLGGGLLFLAWWAERDARASR